VAKSRTDNACGDEFLAIGQPEAMFDYDPKADINRCRISRWPLVQFDWPPL
jgi:hypothetical protein